MISKVWKTNKGRLAIIAITALVLYSIISLYVANCELANSCEINLGFNSTYADEIEAPITNNNELSDSNSKTANKDKISFTERLEGPIYDSYLASVFDTAIFFIIVTLGLTVFGLSKPEDEGFERKLFYLFPDLHKTKEGKEYFLRKINKMAAVSPLSRLTTSFDEYIPANENEYELFKVGSIYEAQISNLHGNHTYIDDDVKISFTMEPGSLSEVLAKVNDTKWGQINMLRTVNNDGLEDPMPWHNGTNRNFINEEHSYRLKEIKIPVQEKINIDVHSWAWSKFGSEKYDYFTVQRFTENLELFFVNNLNVCIEVAYEVIPIDTPKKDITEKSKNLSNSLRLGKAGTKSSRNFFKQKNFTPEDLFIWTVKVTEDEEQIVEKESTFQRFKSKIFGWNSSNSSKN